MPHLRALSESEGILDTDAEVADRALDLRMAEQDLNGAKVTRLLVNDRRLRPAE
jgi:hypothetical protein